MEINYKSDFTLDISFQSGGVTIDTPDCDFVLQFSTGGVNRYTVSYLDEVKTNCDIEDGSIRGIFRSHGLGQGALVCFATLYYPNEEFEDGIQCINSVYNVGVSLISGVGEEMSIPSMSISAPSSDYNTLTNKPQINGVELEGDLSGDDIKLNLSFVSIDE